MLSLLNRAADGNQLLSILDSFVEESGQSGDTNSSAVSYITGEAVEFWYNLSVGAELDFAPVIC
jgi:hypothetical protein